MRKFFQSFIKKYNEYQLGVIFGTYTGFFGVKNILQTKFSYLNIIIICIGIILIIYPRSSKNNRDTHNNPK
jgi:hypothetical protein